MTDPIELAVFKSAVHSIAEEMGEGLRRTAFSPNIKERRDYSCAVFDARGDALSMGDHMPVHLGSMPLSVRAAMADVDFGRGDVVILNDPYAGGTHLPDITMVAGVFPDDSDAPAFYVSARAHHADVGGRYPGSMGLCTDVFQEGIRIPPVKLVNGGVVNSDLRRLLLYNVRTPAEREGDLTAQIGACKVGEERFGELLRKHGLANVQKLAADLLNYSEHLVRNQLAQMPTGVFEAEDYLDDDGVSENPVRIQVSLSLDAATQSAVIDFAGSSAQVASSLNAVYAITFSAVYYVFRCLLPDDTPATSGIMRRLTVLAPEGSVVNAQPPAPVAGGNVETSQRIVDVLLKALAQAIPHLIPAASSGTMSNLTIGGIDPRSGAPFTYYETIAGGMGARPGADGLSGVHTHMTNSLNTPAEALEVAYPLRVTKYSYRRGSGGAGRFLGGDGLIREIELLADAQVTILSDRRKLHPYGLAGGGGGSTGLVSLVRGGTVRHLPSKCSINANAGDRIRIETPGGGGYGVSHW